MAVVESSADSNAQTHDKSVSATQRAYQTLRQLIIHGSIAPGEKLKVESLKEQLSVGATPVREALSLLTSDQLVERIDQRGFRAAPASVDHFREIFNLRCQLEDIALKQSIQKGDTHWEETVVLTHHHLAQTPRTQTTSWEQHHRSFHHALLAGCGSPVLLRFCAQLYDLNIRYRHLAVKSDRYAKRDVSKEHEDILKAVVARHESKASLELLSHYERTGEYLSDQLTLLDTEKATIA